MMGEHPVLTGTEIRAGISGHREGTVAQWYVVEPAAGEGAPRVRVVKSRQEGLFILQTAWSTHEATGQSGPIGEGPFAHLRKLNCIQVAKGNQEDHQREE